MLAPKPEFYMDFTGCGNTMNCNHPVVRRFILDCLRYWVTEMHVDGFRFDLAAVFAIDVDQVEKGKTPIIHEIETDPVLSKIKLIAEPWSITQYRLGSFSDRRWAEWNGKFRDAVRKWVKGDLGVAAEMGARVTGSFDLFGSSEEDQRTPYHSINFVTCHDGFTLNDLVSFNEKHNERNGENNRDGANDNESWNCGHEGFVELSDLPEEEKEAIEELRRRQIKNFLTILFLSQGRRCSSTATRCAGPPRGTTTRSSRTTTSTGSTGRTPAVMRRSSGSPSSSSPSGSGTRSSAVGAT